MENFEREYIKFLKENANPERAKKEKAYLYSDLKHYGVSVWERRKFINKYRRGIGVLSKKDALALVRKYWAMPHFEERSLALDILNTHADKLTLSDMPLIEKMMKESKGWAFLDSLIIPIMPTILTKYPSAYSYLTKWIKSQDFWVRRSALLAQNMFFRAGRGGRKALFFKLAKSQFDEGWIDEYYKDTLSRKRARFFIRKAIGWALREMGAKDPESAFKFLKENKGKMSGLSFKDGSRRLPAKMLKELKAKS